MSVVLRFRCCCWSTSAGTGTVTPKKKPNKTAIKNPQMILQKPETHKKTLSVTIQLKVSYLTWSLVPCPSETKGLGSHADNFTSSQPSPFTPSTSLTIQEGEKHRFPDIFSCCYSYSHFPLSKMMGMNYLQQQRNYYSLYCVLRGQSTGMF